MLLTFRTRGKQLSATRLKFTMQRREENERRWCQDFANARHPRRLDGDAGDHASATSRRPHSCIASRAAATAGRRSFGGSRQGDGADKAADTAVAAGWWL
jgi:hypothetical protein